MNHIQQRIDLENEALNEINKEISQIDNTVKTLRNRRDQLSLEFIQHTSKLQLLKELANVGPELFQETGEDMEKSPPETQET